MEQGVASLLEFLALSSRNTGAVFQVFESNPK